MNYTQFTHNLKYIAIAVYKYCDVSV